MAVQESWAGQSQTIAVLVAALETRLSNLEQISDTGTIGRLALDSTDGGQPFVVDFPYEPRTGSLGPSLPRQAQESYHG
jgi:hypothetical protein